MLRAFLRAMCLAVPANLTGSFLVPEFASVTSVLSMVVVAWVFASYLHSTDSDPPSRKLTEFLSGPQNLRRAVLVVTLGAGSGLILAELDIRFGTIGSHAARNWPLFAMTFIPFGILTILLDRLHRKD